MRSYLINLDRAPERLDYMRGQFAAIGCPFERIAATDGRAMSGEELVRFRAERDPDGWLPGQIGALLSHMEAWRRVAAGSDRWGAIFEDDIHIHPTLARFLSSDRWIPNQADLVRLETTRQGMRLNRTDLAISDISVQLLSVSSGAWGTGAYLIEQSVARWFLATPTRLQAPVDSLLFHQPDPDYPPGLTILQMSPAPCIQDKYHPDPDQRRGFDSAIDGAVSLRRRIIDAAKQRFGQTGRRVLGKRIVAYAGEEIEPSKHRGLITSNG